MMGNGFGFGGFGMMGGGLCMMVLLLIVIGFLFYMGMKKQATNQKDTNIFSQPTADSEAIKIAKSRLTSGEITVEEFEQIKKNLL
jgi:putative membrane protein